MASYCRNHEEEQEADGTMFKSVQARWPVSSLPFRLSLRAQATATAHRLLTPTHT